jgi:hypothetical protein
MSERMRGTILSMERHFVERHPLDEAVKKDKHCSDSDAAVAAVTQCSLARKQQRFPSIQTQGYF